MISVSDPLALAGTKPGDRQTPFDDRQGSKVLYKSVFSNSGLRNDGISQKSLA
jgi:hypothetical protein